MSLLVEVETFQYLNKYLLREKKYKNILKKKWSENIYALKNKNCESLFWRSHGIFIAHESYLFVKRKV